MTLLTRLLRPFYALSPSSRKRMGPAWRRAHAITGHRARCECFTCAQQAKRAPLAPEPTPVEWRRANRAFEHPRGCACSTCALFASLAAKTRPEVTDASA